MSPNAFTRIVHKTWPVLDARLSAESRDALARFIRDQDRIDEHVRADFITLASELFLRAGAVKRR